jgi:PKD repeat protein
MRIRSAKKRLRIFISFLTITLLLWSQSRFVSASNHQLEVSVSKKLYFEHDRVDISGRVLEDGNPTNDLVGIEVRPIGSDPVQFRTMNISRPREPTWVEINNVYVSDQYGVPELGSVRTGGLAYFTIIVKNKIFSPTTDIFVAVTLYDARMIPLGMMSGLWHDTTRGTYPLTISIPVPSWAYPGSAVAIGTAFSAKPENWGTPYCTEFRRSFTIANAGGYVPLEDEAPVSSGKLASFEFMDTSMASFRLRGDPKTGEYAVYATSIINQTLVLHTTETFFVEIASYPPQAAFTYSPPKPYPNGTIEFDASPSTPEGGIIESFIWDWDDGTPRNTTSGTATIMTHKYKSAGTYVVTLNVTDSEGLWSTTSKPVTVYPTYGPIADFTYTPSEPFATALVRFNASSSTLGWNGTGYPRIVSYIWDFGDGMPTYNGTTPVVTHQYWPEGLYNVTLKIIDDIGQWDIETEQLNVTLADIVHDVTVFSIDFISEVHKGWVVPVDVLVYNNGTTTEDFYLEIYLDTNLLLNQSVLSLVPLEAREITCLLSTTSLTIGNYTIKAQAEAIPYETDLQNNVLESQILVKAMGDVNNDGAVDSTDLGWMGSAWGSMTGDPNFEVQCDLNQDEVVDSTDLGWLGVSWGYVGP